MPGIGAGFGGVTRVAAASALTPAPAPPEAGGGRLSSMLPSRATVANRALSG